MCDWRDALDVLLDDGNEYVTGGYIWMARADYLRTLPPCSDRNRGGACDWPEDRGRDPWGAGRRYQESYGRMCPECGSGSTDIAPQLMPMTPAGGAFRIGCPAEAHEAKELLERLGPAEPCGGCGGATAHIRATYRIPDELWEAVAGGDEFLCFGCLKMRLGRPLRVSDFPRCPENRRARLLVAGGWMDEPPQRGMFPSEAET